VRNRLWDHKFNRWFDNYLCLEMQDPRQEQIGVGHPKVVNYILKLSRQLQLLLI